MFVVAQHSAVELPHDWWSNTFRRSIAAFGSTLLVLQPWAQPLALQRSWCLWEIFSSVDSGTKLRVALSAAETALLRDALVRSLVTVGPCRAHATLHAGRCTASTMWRSC